MILFNTNNLIKLHWKNYLKTNNVKPGKSSKYFSKYRFVIFLYLLGHVFASDVSGLGG